MDLVFHGGKCCGIKTIYGFSCAPWDSTAARVASNEVDNGKYGHTVRSDLSFFTDEAPKETYEERLVRFIEFCKRRRPRHMIEAVLANYVTTYLINGGYETRRQDEVWGPVLEKYGFKPVTTFENSNTRNKVTVYHLVY